MVPFARACAILGLRLLTTTADHSHVAFPEIPPFSLFFTNQAKHIVFCRGANSSQGRLESLGQPLLASQDKKAVEACAASRGALRGVCPRRGTDICTRKKFPALKKGQICNPKVWLVNSNFFCGWFEERPPALPPPLHAV